jgi:holo-[acyl-carrier protein] synthase
MPDTATPAQRCGIDTVEIARMERLLAATSPEALAQIFTGHELAESGDGPGRAASLAARFAAKEAVMKALGVGLGDFDFHDVEVVRADSGAPSLVLSGKAKDIAAKLGVVTWHLSLSHTSSTAMAVVIAVGA